MRYLLAIICPPAAVLSCDRFAAAFVNLLLTLLFYFPGMIHACLEVNKFYADRRHRELLRAMRSAQSGDDISMPSSPMSTAQAVMVASSGFITIALAAWWWMFLKHKLGL